MILVQQRRFHELFASLYVPVLIYASRPILVYRAAVACVRQFLTGRSVQPCRPYNPDNSLYIRIIHQMIIRKYAMPRHLRNTDHGSQPRQRLYNWPKTFPTKQSNQSQDGWLAHQESTNPGLQLTLGPTPHACADHRKVRSPFGVNLAYAIASKSP